MTSKNFLAIPAPLLRRRQGSRQALEEGWKRGVAYAMTDGIISRQEEERLRAFRDQLALAGC